MAPDNIQAVVVSEASIERSDTRKEWALIALFGGGVIMTIYATICLCLVSDNPKYVFYLGLCSMVMVFTVLSGLMGMLVRRSLKISKRGIDVTDLSNDDSNKDDDLIERKDAKDAVDKVPPEEPATDVPTDK